jgi:hypothetical protein
VNILHGVLRASFSHPTPHELRQSISFTRASAPDKLGRKPFHNRCAQCVLSWMIEYRPSFKASVIPLFVHRSHKEFRWSIPLFGCRGKHNSKLSVLMSVPGSFGSHCDRASRRTVLRKMQARCGKKDPRNARLSVRPEACSRPS